MEGKRYWLTLNNLKQGRVIDFEEKREEIMRSGMTEWQVLITITSLDSVRFPLSQHMLGQTYWYYGARVQEAKEGVARNILNQLGVDSV